MTPASVNPSPRSLKTEEAMEQTDVLTPIEAAAFLRVSRKTLSRLTLRGDVPHAQVGGQYRYLKSDLAAWLKGGT